VSKPERRLPRATYEDLRRVPPEKVAELVEGELVVSPRPATGHALASSRLGGELISQFDRSSGGGAGPGGWCILHEPELHFAEDVLVPDLAAWRRERMPHAHAREHVRHVWLLDPIDKVLEIFRLEGP
jgi:hypothetical protein